MQDMQPYAIVPMLHDAMNSGGVFLNVKGGGEANTMTISWGTIGIAWGGDVFMTMVRHSRHTHGLIERAGRFTVSIPPSGRLRDALAYCGTKSGRDGDKFAAAGLTAAPARSFEGVTVGECALQVECEIVCATEMDASRLADSIRPAYADGDMHTLYFGKIVACYSTEK